MGRLVREVLLNLPGSIRIGNAELAMAMLVATTLLAGGISAARRFAPSLVVTLGVALALRMVVVFLAYQHTPHDVAVDFLRTGQAVLRGENPLLSLPRYRWNFLPTMPYVHALEILSGLPWPVAGKICPVLADLASIGLIGALAGRERAASVRWQYAIHPLPLLVVAWHGQVEPTAVALGLTSLWLARRQRPGIAGVMLGLAVSVKTWPMLFAPGTARETPVRRWVWLGAGGAAPLGLLLASVPLFLHSGTAESVQALAAYRSYLGVWGWSGVLRLAGFVDAGYAGPGIDHYQRIGMALLLGTLAATALLLWRRLGGVELTAALTLAFLAVTAGFGTQYLLWPAALLLVAGGWRIWPYLTLAAGYAAIFYLVAVPDPGNPLVGRLLVAASVPLIAAAVLAVPTRRGDGGAQVQSSRPSPPG